MLILWQTIRRQGRNGFSEWARRCADTTRYAIATLTGAGWPAWANPWSNTVVIRRPPATIAHRWHLAVTGDIAHLVIMPSVTTSRIDAFVSDLVRARDSDPAVAPGKETHGTP
ncbi:MAG: Histidine decarboxylase [bacterium ADurb.Bin374]|nr:MAG: Histidine decarboxylase [bacterium ADurb.Bin374]